MKVIVTTTINPPTKALMKFLSFKNFDYVIVVGDLITPHSAYEELSVQHNNLIYLSPEFQEKNIKFYLRLLDGDVFKGRVLVLYTPTRWVLK